MQIRMLGPVQAYADGRDLDVGPRQQRHVLAVLAVDAGRVVTTEALMDRVWEQVPSGARRALHVHVTRIRRMLEQADPAGAPATLVRRSGGYLLDVDPDRVDAHRMSRLFEQARAAGCDDRRAALLREAVGLWRAEPLGGLTGSWAARTRERWRRRYLDTVVAWADAEVCVGDPGAVIGTLGDLTDEHPLVEPLAAALMRALYAASGQAEALEHYARVRRHLVDELGVDPGPELQAVYRAILRGGPDPLHAAATPPEYPAPVPGQLPADVAGFTGRTGQLAALDALLTQHPGPAPTAVVISAVCGTAGVGKTALAVHWAHTVANEFPDGQLYVNLRGFDPAGRVTTPAEAVRGLLDALGVPPERVPSTLDAQTALYRSLLAGKHVLVLLDNARDAEQVRPLLPGTPTALALVTSRDQLTPLVAVDGARPLPLDVLSTDEALHLLTERLGAQRITAEPVAVRQIIAACAGLPLALSIAAARAQQSTFALATLATELSQATDRLDALDAGDPTTDVRAVFSWSCAALHAPANRLFRLLGLHPGPDVSIPAAASIAGLPIRQARRLLTELTRANLLVEHVPGRYTMHDLLRAYAGDLAHTTGPDQVGRATARLLDHYTHTAHTANRRIYPARDPIQVPLTPVAPGVSPEHLADHQQAMAWLTAEQSVLLAAVRHAADHGLDAHAWQLAWALDTFLHRLGNWHDHVAVWEIALHAARRLDDATAQAIAHRRLASTHTQLGRHTDANTHLEHALDLYLRTGDRGGQAHTQRNLAYLRQRQGDPERALHHAQQALALYQLTSDHCGQASALNEVGWCRAQLGDYAQAIIDCAQALPLFQRAADHHGQAMTWDSLGYAHHHIGHHDQAVDCYERALTLLRGVGDRYNEADVLTHLGDTHRAAGDPAAARIAWTQALTILTDLEHPDAEAVRARLSAREA
ncbi:tetratricopeptide repeat protein [Plantactinospora sp. CA-290183]|uniref:AfsR/SARP family transcriptional regulator n=1 Tax=Plantactinospora sp. CA-290183 TaxID=3240006 RepID=UPI003D8EC131